MVTIVVCANLNALHVFLIINVNLVMKVSFYMKLIVSLNVKQDILLIKKKELVMLVTLHVMLALDLKIINVCHV